MLKWIERLLLVAGITTGSWYVLDTMHTDYINGLDPPSAEAAPGDSGIAPRASAKPSSLPGEERAAAGTPGSWVARLEAPEIGLMATVLEGSDAATLSHAAGRIEYTAWPATSGNVGIAGHRDTVFRPLRFAKAGQLFRLTTRTRVLEYRVSSITVVAPDAVHVLDPTPGPALTLVTCYPFSFIGAAPQRYIVRADLIGETDRATAPGFDREHRK